MTRLSTIAMVGWIGGIGIGGLGACGGDTGGDDVQCLDSDMDGVTVCDGDCDDNDPLSTPGANEICGDGADNNCDGTAEENCPPGVGTFVSGLTGSDSNPGTLQM